MKPGILAAAGYGRYSILLVVSVGSIGKGGSPRATSYPSASYKSDPAISPASMAGSNLVLQESALVLNDGSVFVYTQMEAISIIHRAKRGRHFHGWKNDPHLSLAPSSVSGLRSGVGVTRFPSLVRAVSVGFHESRETSPPFAGWICAAWAPIARCRGLRRLRRTIRPWLPRSSFGPLGSCGLRMLPPVMGSCPCLSASAGLLF